MGQFADHVRAFRLTVTGDPEAAIRTPIEGVLQAAAAMLAKSLVPHSESRLDELQVLYTTAPTDGCTRHPRDADHGSVTDLAGRSRVP